MKDISKKKFLLRKRLTIIDTRKREKYLFSQKIAIMW